MYLEQTIRVGLISARSVGWGSLGCMFIRVGLISACFAHIVVVPMTYNWHLTPCVMVYII